MDGRSFRVRQDLDRSIHRIDIEPASTSPSAATVTTGPSATRKRMRGLPFKLARNIRAKIRAVAARMK